MMPCNSIRPLARLRLFVVEHLGNRELGERFTQLANRQLGQGDAAAHDTHQRPVRVLDVDLMAAERDSDDAIVERGADRRVAEGLRDVSRILGAVVERLLRFLRFGHLRAFA